MRHFEHNLRCQQKVILNAERKYLALSKHLALQDTFLGKMLFALNTNMPSWSVSSISRKRKRTVMWLQKSHLQTWRSYSKYMYLMNITIKREQVKLMKIYQCKRKTTKGHHVIKSWVHIFILFCQTISCTSDNFLV